MTSMTRMQYASLGRAGLTVSRLCLGTMNFGPLTGEPDSHAIDDIWPGPGGEAPEAYAW